MRLGQLSRKLGLKPSDIHLFLKEKDSSIEANPNTRLSDEQVVLTIRHFDPSREAAILTDNSPAENDSTAENDSSGESDEMPAVETISSIGPEAQPNEPIAKTTNETSVELTPEVIRAPKQDLPGLKVVGKIELKEPKKKEPTSPSVDEPAAPAEQEARPRRSEAVRRERPQRNWQNPLEAQRQREAEERKSKREQEIQRDKDRRTQQYLKKVKSAPTKPVRRQEETVVESQVEARPAPKTWLGKLARWLTT